MPEYVESGMKFALPDGAFRLQDMSAYQRLCGRHLKKMDFGWWDGAEQALVLLEAKGQGVWDSTGRQAAGPDAEGIERKANDTLMMFGATWSKTVWGRELCKALPAKARRYPGEAHLRLIFVIDTPAASKELLLAFGEKINARLAGRLRLFDLPALAILDLEMAKSHGIPVSRV
jgi:hypothetical protein